MVSRIGKGLVFVQYTAIVLWLVLQISTTTLVYAEYPWLTAFRNQRAMLNFLYVLVFLGEFWYIATKTYTKKDVWFVAGAAIMLISPILNNFTMYLGSVLLVFMARRLNLRTLITVCLITVSVCFFTILLATYLHYLPDYMHTRANGVDRHYLGFRYCLFPGMFIFVISCMWCFVRNTQISVFELLFLAVVNYVIYLLTNGRMSLVCSALLLLFCLIYRFTSNASIWPPLAKIGAWTTIFTVILTALVVGLYALQIVLGETWLDQLNAMLSKRIALAYNGIVNIGPSVFGQHVDWVPMSLNSRGVPKQGIYNYVDNMYVFSIIRMGWVYTLGMILLITATARKAAKNNEVILVAIFAVLALHSLLDDTTMRLYFNPLLFCIGPMLYGWERQRSYAGKHAA